MFMYPLCMFVCMYQQVLLFTYMFLFLFIFFPFGITTNNALMTSYINILTEVWLCIEKKYFKYYYICLYKKFLFFNQIFFKMHLINNVCMKIEKISMNFHYIYVWIFQLINKLYYYVNGLWPASNKYVSDNLLSFYTAKMCYYVSAIIDI